MAQFSQRMVTEVVQQFWAAMARGEFITDAAAEAGTHRMMGTRWLRAEGGIRPRRGRDLKGRCLTFAEREEIAVARAGGESMRSIAAGWDATRRRSVSSGRATPIAVDIERPARTRWRMRARAGPSQPSCTPTSSCAA